MLDTKEDNGDDEKIYGGCEGPDAMYVKLVSSDSHEFIVKRDDAFTSGKYACTSHIRCTTQTAPPRSRNFPSRQK